MDLLVHLAAEAGEVRSKEEILDAVWPQQFVAESVLTRAIAELRRALGDDAHNPRFIETIPRRGYRLIAPVTRGGRPRGLLKVMVWVGVAATALWALAQILTQVGDPSKSSARDRSAAQPVPFQLTDSQAVEAYPSFSPDGGSLAYSSNESGSYEIHVRQLVAGGATTRITTDGMVNLQPAWSPDGLWIAFHSLGRGGIWIVPARGGDVRRASDFGSRPAWSPDSREIVFQSTEVNGIINNKAMPPSTLWRIAPGEGEPIQLTRPGEPVGGHGSPSYTADGRFVVFHSGDFGIPGGLWSLRLEDSDLSRIGDVTAARSLVVDPGGRSLYFKAGFRRQQWIFRIDLQRNGIFGEPVPILPTGSQHLAISPDGRRLAMTEVDESSHLWSMALDPGTGERRGGLERLNDATNSRNTLPAISPDGSTMAFHGFYPGRRSMIYLMDLTTRQQTELLAGNWATWTEDGSSLWFWGQGGLNRIEIETRSVQNLAPWPRNRGAVRLSPDGRRLAFHRAAEDGITNVWISGIHGENERRLTDDEEFAGFPLWSPGGDRLAYEIGRSGTTQIEVMDLESGQLEQLTDGPGLSWPEGWSPDGDKIAFAGFRDGVWNIFQVSQSTREVSRLTDYESGIETFVRWPVWSPTGDRIVFERYQASADLWLVDLR